MTECNIGDLLSEEMGSAARASSGKPDWSLMPLGQTAHILHKYKPSTNNRLLRYLATFQESGTHEDALAFLITAVSYVVEDTGCTRQEVLEDVIIIWEFGKRKYAAFNWMKGMRWSAVVASATRHILALIRGEKMDEESEMHHGLHVICNAMMLVHYTEHYQEGNDLPCKFFTN